MNDYSQLMVLFDYLINQLSFLLKMENLSLEIILRLFNQCIEPYFLHYLNEYCNFDGIFEKIIELLSELNYE